MSIVKPDSGNELKPTNGAPRQRFDWESEQTIVEQRRRWYYRVLRLITFWRVVIVAVIALLVFDPGVAFFIRHGWDQAQPLLDEMFSFRIDLLVARAFELIMFIGIAIGQFALLFWFLGRARMYTIWPGTTTEGVGFRDYRGQPELLEQARQIVKLLRGVKVFEESGGEPLNGLLLEGPPGTGKTWLAQAISTEAGVPFFYIDASSMQSMFVGIAPLKVMNLYRKARNAAKDYGASIIFIDEIDAIGARPGVSNPEKQFRPADNLNLNSTRLPMFFGMGGTGLLSTLLTEMDGFSLEHGWWARKRTWFYQTILRRRPPKPERRVMTIGATNRIAALDQALLRPGRFDKKIHVDAPDMEGRRDIFEYYLSKVAHDDSLDPLVLASETPFYTPADIKYLLNEALRYALFDGRTYITAADIHRAQPEHEMGLRTPIKNIQREDKRRLAAHEAGHAVAVRLYMPSDRIARVTIIRQGGALGYVLHYPSFQRTDYTFEWLMNHLRVAVAGRAGELEFCGVGQETLGVGGDFASIRFALNMMAEAGMFGALGVSKPEAKEVLKLMEEAFVMVLTEVRMALREHHDMGEALINLLLEKEELHSGEVEAFFDQYGLYTPKINIVDPKEIVA